ncbi:hypothetical protein DFJ77DRAFT_108779 [Powellomyces hirtus]|nr:hypothetical protein DFJ77DRAFT_108779 [Powellomyces hirtus]
MVQVVRHANGEVTAKHADGTVIATTGEGGVEVVSIGFAGVVLKGGNSTVEFENGAVFERVKDGAHVEFRIRKGDDLFVVASDGTAQVTPAYRHPAAIAPVGVHVLDWANGTLGTEDAGGTRFSVDKSGNCMVKPPASKTDSPSPPSTSTVSKPPKLTRTIPHTVRETLIKHVTSPSTPIRNSPRLFVLHTDGYGHELLRDADLVSFLKDATRKSAAGQGVWIMEEPLVDARESVGVTVIVGRMDEEDGNAGGIVQGAVQYRQLIRHPRLSSPAITALVSEYNELDSILSAPDNTLSNAPPIDETCEQVSAELCASLKPSPSMSNQTAHYGLSREETEARIKARYALREESAMAVGTSPQQNMENRGDADDGAASSRLVAPTKPLRAIVPVPPAATASTTMASLSTAPSTAVSGSVAAGSASSSITNNNNGSSRRKRRSLHRMLNDAEIPRYFDSPEGRARFSEAPPVSIPPPTTTATETSPPHFSSLHHPTTPSTGASSSPPTTAPAPTHNDRQQQADSPQRASSPLKTDVLGRPRRSKLQLPSVLRSSKGGAVPNAEYAAVENSARRTVKTSSTAGLKDEAALNSLGTFEIYPSRINFGTIVVQPGGSTATGVGGGGKASLHLVNVGNCAARFKVVKQQKQNSWIETSFTPGPVRKKKRHF